jgi:hypothetical protein
MRSAPDTAMRAACIPSGAVTDVDERRPRDRRSGPVGGVTEGSARRPDGQTSGIATVSVHRAAPRVAGWTALAAGVVALALFRAGTLVDSDVYWQAAGGFNGLEARSPGWHPNSPLWNVVLGGVWRAGGSWGLVVIGAATVVVLGTLLILVARRLGAGPLSCALALLVTVPCMLPVLSARPALPATTLLLGATAAVPVALAYCTGRRTGTWWRTALICLLAAGLGVLGPGVHLSWTFNGPVLALAWMATAVAAPRGTRGEVQPAALAGPGIGGTVVCALAPPAALIAGLNLGPGGTDIWRQTLDVRSASVGLVSEWDPTWTRPGWALITLLALGVAVTSTSLGVRRRDPMLLAWGVTTLALAGGAVTVVRLAPWAAAACLPLLAAGGSALARTHAVPPVLRRPALAAALSAVAVSPVLVVPALARHAAPPDAQTVTLLPAGCRLAGPVGIGNQADLLRPDVVVLLDGRNDFWGRDAYARWDGLANGQAPASDATCAVVPAGSPLTRPGSGWSVVSGGPDGDQVVTRRPGKGRRSIRT